MGRKLAIAREAIRDLDEIWDYIAADSVSNADRFIDRIHEKCREIADLDGVGRKREELHPGMLSLPFKKYVIFFMRSESMVHIVRILHGARDVGGIFQKEEKSQPGGPANAGLRRQNSEMPSQSAALQPASLTLDVRQHQREEEYSPLHGARASIWMHDHSVQTNGISCARGRITYVRDDGNHLEHQYEQGFFEDGGVEQCTSVTTA